ncbi:hypothetical protein LIER_31062 [Lithospermum erythrorhizon]|uniref:pectinesterase n=1 Tax=Lithospermum erythrorhizon TaxID=34254 RepID=A0AAV3RPQ4_LITER
MKSNSLPLVIFPLLLIHFHQSVALLEPATLDESYATSPMASQPPESDVKQFIHTSCQSTLYQDLCFNSLIFYANTIQHDSARLTRIAIKISLTRAKNMANYISYLSSQADSGGEPTTKSALHDCYALFGDAVDQMRDSLKQMQQLNGSGGSLRFQMSNVQTWLSAAMTNEDTCSDGLSDVPNLVIKENVMDRVNKAMHVTSNALALVNKFVAQVVKP